jgi:hypothetical protein
MPKKPVRVDLTFDVAPTVPAARPADMAAMAVEAARRSAAEAAEAERRAFADTEPAFLDTQARDDG